MVAASRRCGRNFRAMHPKLHQLCLLRKVMVNQNSSFVNNLRRLSRFYTKSSGKKPSFLTAKMRNHDNCVSKHFVNRRGGASRSESKSNDCRWQSNNDSIGYQPPEDRRNRALQMNVYPGSRSPQPSQASEGARRRMWRGPLAGLPC